MGRYYVHLDCRDATYADDEGREFATAEDAVAFGIEAARSIIAADAMSGHIDLHQVIRIVASDQATVREVPFRDVVAFREEWTPTDKRSYI